MAALDNPKHEHFAQLYASGVSGTEAAKTAGYSERRAHVTASELVKDRKVAGRIAELRGRIAERTVAITAYDLAAAMREAEEARKLAMDESNPHAVVAAVTLKAKLNGLLIDRKEVRTGPLDGKSDAELDDIIRRAAAEVQISLGPSGEGEATKH